MTQTAVAVTDEYLCPGCGKPTAKCSSALSKPPTPQRSIFCSYPCWTRYYDRDMVTV